MNNNYMISNKEFSYKKAGESTYPFIFVLNFFTL